MARQQSPLYEQVSGADPGQPFTPSGLYTLVGHCRGGRFVPLRTASPLHTEAEWLAIEDAERAAEEPTAGPMRWRCPNCLSFLRPKADAQGQQMVCPQCEHVDIPRQPDATSYGLDRVMSFDPPKTLDRVVALRQEPHAVADHQPVRAVPLAPPQPRQTVAAPVDGLGQVLRLQAQRGWRPAPETPLRTMAAQSCERCGRSQCGCPPPAPDVLGAAVTRRRREWQQREQSFDTAGFARLTDLPRRTE